MADSPLNINMRSRLVAAQSASSSVVTVSFESSPINLGAGEVLDVSGVSVLFAYGGGVATAYSDKAGTVSGALFTKEGTAVNVTGAQPIDVRGVSHISFAGLATVVLAG